MNASMIDTIQDAASAVAWCREQLEPWRRTTIRERLGPVRELRRLLVRECDALCEAVRQDIGKPAQETIGGEILPLADACQFLEREAASVLRPRRVPRRSRPVWFWGQKDTVYRRPRGVVAVIGTWNYPLILNGVQIVQALTAGNGVVWKPSEVAPASADVLQSLLQRAGFPPGLVQTLPATREGGPALIEADIDHVVFTGGVAAGRQIARRLGERLITSALELSGCDPMFVLADAEVSLAAPALWFGATLNRGQTCIGSRRAFVHRSLYEELTRALEPWAAAAAPVRLALASQARQAERMVEDALEKGARLLAPARAAGGDEAHFRPTVLLDADPNMEVCRDASFAPLLAIVPFDDLQQALEANAACPFGLGASIFTSNLKMAEELARKLRTGMVAVNDVIAPTAHPATPFGGLGESGWGVTQGPEGLLELTVPQVVSVKSGLFRPHYDMATRGPGGQEGLLRGLLRFCHGRGLLERWRGLRQLISGFRQSGK
jgi:acyl-CoA reductase-like NAD-dependent aldehyde dehydrogenase